MKICPKCLEQHNKQGIFCSRKCANSRGPRTDEFKIKVSQKLKGRPPWNTGKTLTKEHSQKISEWNTGKKRPKLTDSEIFCENSSVARQHVKKRIIDNSYIEYKCSCCGLGNEWNGKPLCLQLDHINGINNDHRLQNLRFLCPNCHTQQETYAAKNRFNPNRKPKKYL